LITTDADELRQRILVRNDGWRDDDGAVTWNQRVIDRATLRGEYKLDTAGKSAAQVADEAMKWLLALQRYIRSTTGGFDW
jgi:hypothetical protein